MHCLTHPGAPHHLLACLGFSSCPRGTSPDNSHSSSPGSLTYDMLHICLPIELEVCKHGLGWLYSRVCGLGPSWTGAPIGDCRPEDVGLSGVSISLGRIHDEHRPGDRVLSTFSGSDSTLQLGMECSSLHMCAAKCDCISDFSRILSISV